MLSWVEHKKFYNLGASFSGDVHWSRDLAPYSTYWITRTGMI